MGSGMNDDIIRMAREAGCIPRRHPAYDNDVQVFATPDVLERFYQLAVAKEREACAKVCDEQQELVGAEMCCVAMNCAAAIRARGQA